MAEYTWAELKDLTSVPAVAVWSEAKCLKYQAMAESILAGLGLDSSIDGYSEAYSGAVLLIFDILAENPTGLTSSTQGRVSKNFGLNGLPPSVRNFIAPYLKGGTLSGAPFKRNDVGLR